MQICSQHALPFQSLCIDEKCSLPSFSCQQCHKEHQCPKMEIAPGLEVFSKKLQINLDEIEKLSTNFKAIDMEVFTEANQSSKKRISDDIHIMKREFIKQIDTLEEQLLKNLDGQMDIYNKNIQFIRDQLKETDRFQNITKHSDLQFLQIKLSSQDPNLVLKKIKADLISFSTFNDQGRLQQLKENLLLIHAQTLNPPIYRSTAFHESISTLSVHFGQFLQTVEQEYISYKNYPIKDLEVKPKVEPPKQSMKIIDELNCITTLIIIEDYLIYALSDITIKLYDEIELESILLESTVNCMIQLPYREGGQPIGKLQKYQRKFSMALGLDNGIQIWTVNEKLSVLKELKNKSLNRCISLVDKKEFLYAGDWDGNLFIVNLQTYAFVSRIDTLSNIIFSILNSADYIITASKCDMQQGGVIIWKGTESLTIEKRLTISNVENIAVSKTLLYVVDNKLKLYIFDANKLTKSYVCSQSVISDIYVNDGALYILNQTALIKISTQTEQQSFENFPCLQCRQYYQGRKLFVSPNKTVFVRHFHQCQHEQLDDEKCQMKSNLFILIQ